MTITRYLSLLILCAPLLCAAQDEAVSSKKNVIKLLVTPSLFYNNALVLGYERVMRRPQSISVAAGTVTFPKVFSQNNFVNAIQAHARKGFMAAVDYRFYLAKENKNPAPHGVYLAPFVSYYRFENEWQLQGTSSTPPTNATLTGDLAFLNIGGQIGYQFIVKERLTLDFIFFGPSITNYQMNLDLQGNFTVDEEDEVIKALLSRYPLLDQLVDEDSVTVNGRNSIWSLGYRFTFMIGYTFGRKP